MHKVGLFCIRTARKEVDGRNGYLYFHYWPTGHQELIFSSHKAAHNFERREREKSHA